MASGFGALGFTGLGFRTAVDFKLRVSACRILFAVGLGFRDLKALKPKPFKP